MARVIIDKNSDAYKRVTSARFMLGPVEFRKVKISGGYYLRGFFTCVCNRVEGLEIAFIDLNNISQNFHFRKKNSQVYIWDMALALEQIGALSIEHLKKDGYSDEEIGVIRRAYD